MNRCTPGAARRAGGSSPVAVSSSITIMAALVATAAVLLGAAKPAGTASDARRRAPAAVRQASQANPFHALMGITEGELLRLDFDGRAGRIPIEIDGVARTLDLDRHSVRSAGYVLYEVGADGVRREVPPSPVNTLRGTVVEEPGSVVAGAVLADGLHAMIDLADGERWWLVPLAGRLGGLFRGLYVVYPDGAEIPGEAVSCGLRHDLPDTRNEPAEFELEDEIVEGHPAAAGLVGGPSVAELACDADFDYFQEWGAGTEDRINAIINIVNVQYERDVDVTHEITAIVVHTSSVYSNTEPNALLSEFRNHWLIFHSDISRDLTHLFTGKNLDGNVIGVAWTVGAVCSIQAYSLAQTDYNGIFGCATDLTAHEMGHIWNGSHCSCAAPGYTMNPSITCTNRFKPSVTIPDLIAHRDSRSCLDSEPPAVYCPASSASSQWEYISRVSLGSIDNASGPSVYSDYTTLSTELARGAEATITITLGTSFAFDRGGAWIDFNGDADFADAGEALSTEFAGTGPYTAVFTVPASATLGATRLRVRVQDGASDPSPVPCGATDYGEVEDYSVTIVAATVQCPADVDGDERVGFYDLVAVLSSWGPCAGCPADVDSSGSVGSTDLFAVLSEWGDCD